MSISFIFSIRRNSIVDKAEAIDSLRTYSNWFKTFRTIVADVIWNASGWFLCFFAQNVGRSVWCFNKNVFYETLSEKEVARIHKFYLIDNPETMVIEKTSQVSSKMKRVTVSLVRITVIKLRSSSSSKRAVILIILR